MSAAKPLVALIDEATIDRGGVLLLSPAVGIIRGIPAPGHALASGEVFARIEIVGRSHPLLVPEDLSGVVAELAVEGFGADAIPVEYAQPLLTIVPGAGAGGSKKKRGKSSVGAVAARGSGSKNAHDLPAGCHAIVSPADGVFYRRSRPADPPYVEEGSHVHAGQTLALIEAMKCFSAITYGGAGLPENAEIVEVRAGDAVEVRHGQVLFVAR